MANSGNYSRPALALFCAASLFSPALSHALDSKIPAPASASVMAPAPAPGTPESVANSVNLVRPPQLTPQQTANIHKNFARAHMGAMLSITSNGKSVNPQPAPAPVVKTATKDKAASDDSLLDDGNILLCDDYALSYQLPAGKTTLIVTLSDVVVVDRILLTQEKVSGNVIVSSSNVRLPAGSSRWKVAVPSAPFPTDADHFSRTVAFEARFVKFDIDLSKPARFRPLGVYGNLAAPNFVKNHNDMLVPKKENLKENLPTPDIVNYNYAAIYNSSQVAFVSSGTDLSRSATMIDDDAQTGYDFNSTDPEPTVVVDMGGAKQIRRVTTLCRPADGRVDFYLMDKLPGTELNEAQSKKLAAMRKSDWRLNSFLASLGSPFAAASPPPGTGALTLVDVNNSTLLQIPRSFFENNKAVMSRTLKSTDKSATMEFDVRGARYLLIRWIPDNLGTASPLRVWEICAFGNTRLTDEEPPALANVGYLDDPFALNATTTPPAFDPPNDTPVPTPVPTPPPVSP